MKRSHEDIHPAIFLETKFIDRSDAEKMCKKKLKISPNLYTKVLVKNTLKYVKESIFDCFPIEDEPLNLEPVSKCFKLDNEEDDDDERINDILSEMILPCSNLVTLDDFSFDWPELSSESTNSFDKENEENIKECSNEHSGSSEMDIVPVMKDVVDSEENMETSYLEAVLRDRTNCTIIKFTKSNSMNNNLETQIARISSSKDPNLIRPDISLLPSSQKFENMFPWCEPCGEHCL